MTGILGDLSSAICASPASSSVAPGEMTPHSRNKIVKAIERLREQADLVEQAIDGGAAD